MTRIPFRRGDIWEVDFVPARGHEQDGRRPAVIVSVDTFSNGPARLVAVVPITKTDRHQPFHVPVRPPEGGLRIDSYILCDQLVTVEHGRVLRHWGALSAATMQQVEERLRIVLGL